MAEDAGENVMNYGFFGYYSCGMRRFFIGPFALLFACASSPPSPTPPSPAAAAVRAAEMGPGTRARGASLFGTDVWGLPTGASLTPDAAPGAKLFELNPHLPSAPDLRAANAVSTALSPDGSTLLLLTSGYNRTYDALGDTAVAGSSEYVFVYDVSGALPRETQVIGVPNSFGGLAFHPAGDRFYVSGGSDDVVRELARDPVTKRWAEAAPPIALGHLTPNGYGGLGIGASPYAAGIALNASGALLVVANFENDSVTLIDTATRSIKAEIPLFPGGGVAGGEFPAGVLVSGERAYVASQRDREVVELSLASQKVTRRIRVGGQPTKLLATRSGARVFVANANSDSVSVIDRDSGAVISEVRTPAPPGAGAVAEGLRGSNPNALALSPDERTLYVTNGGNSTLAVIALSERDRGAGSLATPSRVVGLVPTGFYPNAVSASRDGGALFVAHGKSPSGPNPLGPWSNPARARTRPYAPGVGNQFSLQTEHGGLLALPVPRGETLAKLTAQSILNNRFQVDLSKPPMIAALAGKVKHVIYVIGENRTYDQVFGDLHGTDGDPRLTYWGESITPNHHALARSFVALDRFFDSGGVSGDGWEWTVSGRTSDVAEQGVPIEYADRGHHTYDWEGANRGINVGLASLDARLAFNPHTPSSPDLLPGTADVGAVDGPAEGGRGFLWDVALAAGLRVRNYGVFCEGARYGFPASDPARVPPIRLPSDTQTRVAFPTKASLQSTTDPYFRGFDMSFPDYWRYVEWAREFDEFVAKGDLPALELVRLPHDHLGNFDSAEDGVTTPDTQMADNDYALGLLVEKVSKSPFWKDTVIVAIEDDAQNGSDHVDAHRSFALFAGGHVRRGAVVSTAYATPSILRTIELLLGLPALGQQDAFAPPMDDVLDVKLDETPFTAQVPAVLRTTSLPLPAPRPGGASERPRGDAAYWALVMRGFDFSREDTLPTELFNDALACGLGKTREGCASRARPLFSSASTKASPDGDDD